MPFNVKMLFFKSFLMPYFDYCSSLCIYFNTAALHKLNKMFFICLFKLFKFKFENQTLSQINEFLNQYGINSLQFRLISNTLIFIAKVASIDSAPSGLKQQIQRTTVINNLRSNGSQIVKVERCNSKYGDLTFQFIAAKLINKLHFLNFYNNIKLFKNLLKNKINEISNIFISNFVKLNLNLNFKFF